MGTVDPQGQPELSEDFRNFTSQYGIPVIEKPKGFRSPEGPGPAEGVLSSLQSASTRVLNHDEGENRRLTPLSKSIKSAVAPRGMRRGDITTASAMNRSQLPSNQARTDGGRAGQ